VIPVANPNRDHLFVSYAGEDGALAEWLTLKLTGEGYAVWCDRTKLLGGESYPRDIDDAIKNRTFRLLALLSRASLAKDNPVKERTLALNLGRSRREDFLIPINVDGLTPSELDWMTADLTFTPFHNGWASGFGQLLEKLETIDAPKPLGDAQSVVAEWYGRRGTPTQKSEKLWSNVLEVRGVPNDVIRMELSRPGLLTWPDDIPIHWQGDTVAWVLEMAPGRLPLGIAARAVAWDVDGRTFGVYPTDVVTILLNQYLRRVLCARGLQLTPAGDLFFPKGLLPHDRLHFTTYTGTKTWVFACGNRTFRLGTGGREVVGYHLSLAFRPDYRTVRRWVVQLQVRLHLTDAEGKPLEVPKLVRRRKAIGRMWFNHQWLTRLIAVTEWLVPDGSSLRLARTLSSELAIASRPTTTYVDYGIDETAMANAREDDDDEVDDIDEDGEAED
jgi:TIR domain